MFVYGKYVCFVMLMFYVCSCVHPVAVRAHPDGHLLHPPLTLRNLKLYKMPYFILRGIYYSNKCLFDCKVRLYAILEPR